MKIKELIKRLEKHDQDAKVVVFAAGAFYAIHDTVFDNEYKHLELGCGWLTLCEDYWDRSEEEEGT